MIYLPNIMSSVMPMLAKSTVLDRWSAMRGAASPAKANSGLSWVIAIGLIVVVVAMVVVPLLMYFRKRFVVLLGVLRTVMMSPSAARKTGGALSAGDIDILSQMVRQSGFIKPEMEFTLQHAFHVGMANYLGSDDYSELSGEQRRDIAERIEMLEMKLDAGRQERAEQALTTREIPVGAQIMVSCGTSPQDDFEMIVRANTDKGLKMESPAFGKPAKGSSWIFRYFDGVMVWGFTTPMVAFEGASMWFRHTHELEMINSRRFKRVAVDCAANLCLFTFRTSAEMERPVEFVPANVVEIGGPGVLLKTKLQACVGDRVLIQLHLGTKEVIQSIGKIRRRSDVDSRTNLNCYGVELVGLKPSQVAELMQATNNAAIQLRKEEQKEKEAASETIQEEQAVATA